MKTDNRKHRSPNKYDYLVVMLMALGVIFATVTWIWFAHENEQIEKKIHNIK